MFGSESHETAVLLHVGRRIAAARAERGLSVKVLAVQIGVSIDRLAQFEHGHQQLPLRVLYDIAAALGKPMAFFFDDLPGQLAPAEEGALQNTRARSFQESRELAEAFENLADPEMQREVVRLVKDIADCYRRH